MTLCRQNLRWTDTYSSLLGFRWVWRYWANHSIVHEYLHKLWFPLHQGYYRRRWSHIQSLCSCIFQSVAVCTFYEVFSDPCNVTSISQPMRNSLQNHPTVWVHHSQPRLRFPSNSCTVFIFWVLFPGHHGAFVNVSSFDSLHWAFWLQSTSCRLTSPCSLTVQRPILNNWYPFVGSIGFFVMLE